MLRLLMVNKVTYLFEYPYVIPAADEIQCKQSCPDPADVVQERRVQIAHAQGVQRVRRS